MHPLRATYRKKAELSERRPWVFWIRLLPSSWLSERPRPRWDGLASLSQLYRQSALQASGLSHWLNACIGHTAHSKSSKCCRVAFFSPGAVTRCSFDSCWCLCVLARGQTESCNWKPLRDAIPQRFLLSPSMLALWGRAVLTTKLGPLWGALRNGYQQERCFGLLQETCQIAHD